MYELRNDVGDRAGGGVLLPGSFIGLLALGAFLDGVQVLLDLLPGLVGEPLGGGSKPEDAFESIPVPGAQAPAAGTPAGAPVGQPADGGMFGGLGS